GDCKAFWKKRFAAAASRFAESEKSIVAPVESTARYRYCHAPATQIISFVHSPGTVGRFQFPAATLVELRRVALDPPPDRGVVRSKAPLNQKFLDVPIRQGEPQIPTHRAKNNLWFEVSPFEQRRLGSGH